MTTAERLIKAACEIRRDEIDREPLGVPDKEVLVSKLPAHLRRAVTRYRLIQKEASEILEIIRTEGYQPPSNPRSITLQRDYQRYDPIVRDAQSKKLTRKSAISKLQTVATVASMGLSAANVKPLLEKLHADLAKV